MKLPGWLGMSTAARAVGGLVVRSSGVICPVAPDAPAFTTNARLASGVIAIPSGRLPTPASDPGALSELSTGVTESDPDWSFTTSTVHDLAPAEAGSARSAA